MIKKILSISSFILLIPSLACANVIWPALIAEGKITSIPIIAASLIIEFLIFLLVLKIEFKKAIYCTLLANIASGLLGLILRPLSGVLWELTGGVVLSFLFDWGTFNFITWISVGILGSLINALIEISKGVIKGVNK